MIDPKQFFLKIKSTVLKVYNTVVTSIAFYPSLISFCLLLLAFVMLQIENSKFTNYLLEHASFLVINDSDTARTILSTLIAGIISLTVFSFSMVMLLLSQASSNFSPRLLPGLISDKRNQIVLGFYIGTILYNIFMLINILPTGDDYTMHGFSILIGIILGVVCLFLFVFFIHSISTGIQINNIIRNIYKSTKKRLEHLIESDRLESEGFPEVSDDWLPIQNKNAGYFYGIDRKLLEDFAEENECDIKVVALKGNYMLPNEPILFISKSISEELQISLSNDIVLTGQNKVSENYVLGFKQITEVGIKAMSPALNDTGTAKISIDYLTELFALRMKLSDRNIVQSSKGNHTIEITTVNFDELLYENLAAYREYCKHDIIISEKLIKMLKYLKDQEAENESYYEVIEHEIDTLFKDLEKNIHNKNDFERLKSL